MEGSIVNRSDYLSRIGVATSDLAANEQTLRLLQRQHLLTVPFENLDIIWKRPIAIDVNKFYEKIVANRRGGFCYELNGLFNELLRDIGFETRLISARVFNGTVHTQEFDHAAIVVSLPEGEYLTDVGYGEFTTEPLKFVLDEPQTDQSGTFTIRRFDDDYFEVTKLDGDAWKSEYIFKDITRELSEFSEMCDFQQYSPDSHFNQWKLCSIMTADGRKTLTNDKFIVTKNGAKTETAIAGESEFAKILLLEFGIEQPLPRFN